MYNSQMITNISYINPFSFVLQRRQDLANKESEKSKTKKNKTIDIHEKSGKSADELSDTERPAADEVRFLRFRT